MIASYATGPPSPGSARTCRPCQNAKTRESIVRRHGTTRHYHLKRRYGIGADEVQLMLDAQKWRCLICAAGLTAKTAHVDHDHATGAVRGILCFNCNIAIGQVEDDEDRLAAAMAYVARDAELTAAARDRVLALAS